MKHVDLFDAFLRDNVNLNATRVTELQSSTAAIESFVEASAWPPEIDSWLAQGSWAHKTIIKPTDFGEFDADLLVFVHPVDGWSAADYVNTLYNVFTASGTYRDKVRRWSHCVTITYANDKQIDVAPCVINRNGYQRLEVCNRDTNTFERSEPRQFTSWIVAQNSYSGSNSFRKVTRLLKYIRDIKGTFTCSSVLLTTLLGSRISALDRYGVEFSDTPTALKTVIGRLDDFLQANLIKPAVCNPYLPGENFADVWTDAQYGNFRSVVKRYRTWIDDAFSESERSASISKWRRVFGEDFASSVVLEEARSVSKVALDGLRHGVATAALLAAGQIFDLVSAVKAAGRAVLPFNFHLQPHMQQPPWSRAASGTFDIHVRATLYRSRGYDRVGTTESLQPLQAGYWLSFQAVTSNGLPPGSNDYRVEWRITNTDTSASKRTGGLRGGFESSDRDQSRWERLEYRGVHITEAFVIRKRDDLLVAQSSPFYVMVE